MNTIQPIRVQESLNKLYNIQIMNFMSAMVQIFSFGERWNARFNKAKPRWMVHFIFRQMKIFVPLYYKWELAQRSKFLNKFKRKSMKLLQLKIFTSRVSNSLRKVLPRRLRHAKHPHCPCCICPVYSFLFASFLQQNIWRLYWKY